MAKLKTRTNQPVIDEEGLLDYIAQDGNTTQIGGNLEVDGEIIAQPTPISIFGSITSSWTKSIYTKEQLISIVEKNRMNGFSYYEGSSIGYLKELNKNAEEGQPLFIIENATFTNFGGFGVDVLLEPDFMGWSIIAVVGDGSAVAEEGAIYIILVER